MQLVIQEINDAISDSSTLHLQISILTQHSSSIESQASDLAKQLEINRGPILQDQKSTRLNSSHWE